jgi:hypothetical protein
VCLYYEDYLLPAVLRHQSCYTMLRLKQDISNARSCHPNILMVLMLVHTTMDASVRVQPVELLSVQVLNFYKPIKFNNNYSIQIICYRNVCCDESYTVYILMIP